MTNLALVCQKCNRRWASIVLAQTYNRRLRDKFECRIIIKVTDNLRSCDVAWQKDTRKNSLKFPKDCVTNLSLSVKNRHIVHRLSSNVHRPSSIVYRPESSVWVLAHATNLTLVCQKWAYRLSSIVYRPSSIVYRPESSVWVLAHDRR